MPGEYSTTGAKSLPDKEYILPEQAAATGTEAFHLM